MPESARVAIVTGAARSIGDATARRLTDDGFTLAVLDLEADDCRATVAAIPAPAGPRTSRTPSRSR